MNILVINLTRFGDLLQTQPVLSGLREQGNSTGLVCLDNFSSAARLLNDLDHVHPLPGARLMALSDKDWREAVRELSLWAEELQKDFPPEQSVNLTPSLSARLLSGRLGAAEPAGFLLDEFGFGINSTPWAAFLQLASGKRGLSPFNVVDLFRKAAGLNTPCPYHLRSPLPNGAARGIQLIRDHLSDPNFKHGNPTDTPSNFVAFQLGASENRRRWPMDHFVSLARILSDEGCIPVLLGTESEAELGQRFAAEGPVHANLMGKTSLEQLAGTLQACRMLVTGDTGTMHLAAGLGVPTAAVFLATAQPWDTGPYKAGCLCLEPDLDCHPCSFGKSCERGEVCRTAVRPEAMAEYVLHHLRSGEWPEPVSDIASETASGTRAWVTRCDGEGFMTLRSLSGHGSGDRARWMEIQHLFYRRFLDGDPPPENAPRCELSPETAAYISSGLREAGELLALVEQQANLLAVRPMEKLKTKFLAYCRRITSCLEANDHLAVLGSLWTVESRHHGTDMASFAALAHNWNTLIRALSEHLSSC